MTGHVRPFRLYLSHQVLDGWEAPDGLAVAVDDPEYGLTSAAPTLADLIRGYGGGHIEWPEHHTNHQQEGGHT
ncbi:hypothetical protein ACIQVC_37280 [Streptomyces sp. NPDC101112]|uniref:hypothetical protein n=1 Tax=Streptomyces sp. NPDC101112 TaxID=3366105 RepID=UPI0037FF1276